MRNRTLHFIGAFLVIFAVSCQNSGNNSGNSGAEEQSSSMEVKSSAQAQLEAIKDKSNDLMEEMRTATYAERKNLKDDIEDFVSETKETLTEMETDSELEQGTEEMLDKIEDNANILIEEAMQFENKTEEEWEETTANVSSKMKEIGDEIEGLFSK